MINIDVISGFLGAGKTTFIKKYLDENINEKIAIIENEFGEVSVDGDLLRRNDVSVSEISSGCICCSIEGDFKRALLDIIKKYSPDRILIEPSGVAKLSEVKLTISEITRKYHLNLNYIFTVVDSRNYKLYMENFSDFYKDQIVSTKTIVLTRINEVSNVNYDYILNDIKKLNKNANIIVAPLDELNLSEIKQIADSDNTKMNEKKIKKSSFSIINKSIIRNKNYAENVFDSWGKETNKVYSIEKIKDIFNKIREEEDYGFVIRGKGIVRVSKDKWVEFQYTPGVLNIEDSREHDNGKVVIIGEKIDKDKLKLLFR